MAGMREASKVIGDVRQAVSAMDDDGGAQELPNPDSIPQFLRVVFAFTTIDIENTLRRSCDLVLRDTGADKGVRNRRAQADPGTSATSGRGEAALARADCVRLGRRGGGVCAAASEEADTCEPRRRGRR